MKTTIELADDLLERSRAVAQREGSTLRALVEEGLQLALKRRASRTARAVPALPTYGRGGLLPAFESAGWGVLRGEIHGLPSMADGAPQ